MNTATTTATTASRERPWSRPVWILVVAFTCAAQFGLILLLGTRHPIQARIPWPTPPVTLVGDKCAALAELTDPTLFVLPSRHGFSGDARAITPRTQFVAADWTEPFRWMPLAADKLGQTFQQLLATDLTPPVQIAEKTEPRVPALVTAPALVLPTQSQLRIEGGLAGRILLSPPDLPSWPSTDELKTTRLQVIVDARGRVVSAVILTSSNLTEADQRALEVARAAHFEPVEGTGLTWGRMVFAWHTAPLPTADALAAPQPLP